MGKLFETRRELQSLFEQQKEYQAINNYRTDSIDALLQTLQTSDISIAVVGEINRGKSTFMNALLGDKIFPARVTVCTSGVTILDNGTKPKIEVCDMSGKVKNYQNFGNIHDKLVELVSRKNKDAKSIQYVKIEYPNPFTGNGVMLIDTPGVNDPDTWREEITYTYLSNADAVIMLLDPMQPISFSEREFLQTKILGNSIANLIFVVNKVDFVSPAERSDAIDRIESVLGKLVVSPRIHAISAKEALEAKMTGDKELLRSSGFESFEAALIDFLEQGRAGALYLSKLEKGSQILGGQTGEYSARLKALDLEKGELENKLADAKSKLEKIRLNMESVEREVDSNQLAVERSMREKLEYQRTYFNESLAPFLVEGWDADKAREQVLLFQRDTIGLLRLASENELQTLMETYGEEQKTLSGEIVAIMQELNGFENPMLLETVESVEGQGDAGIAVGALTGAGMGAVGGMVAAAGATTTTVAATGAIVTASTFSALGVLGIGILTGGLGLLVGLGIGALASASSGQQKEVYVRERDLTSGRLAINAVERLLANVDATLKELSKTLVQTATNRLLADLQKKEKTLFQSLTRLARM